MKFAVHTEADAIKVSARSVLLAGTYLGRIIQAVEKVSKTGNGMIELLVAVASPGGGGREFFIRDWLVAHDRSALKLRHASEAIGQLAKYEAGEIGAEDFIGRDVRVKVSVEKRRNFGDQNRIEDYAPL